MAEWFYRIRLKLAYLICPEYFNDIEHRLSGLLWHTTGGLLSNTNYTLDGMMHAVNDYQQRMLLLMRLISWIPKEKALLRKLNHTHLRPVHTFQMHI